MRGFRLAAVAALVLGACSSPAQDLPTTTETQGLPTTGATIEVLDWLLVAGPVDPSGCCPAALLEGTVVIDTVNFCVMVKTPGTQSPISVIFPPGTTLVDSDNPTVVLADGRQLRNGDYVEMGGGEQPEENLAIIDSLEAHPGT